MNHAFSIDILQNGDRDRRAGGFQRGIVGIFAVGLEHETNTFPVVRNGESDLLCPFARHCHELAGDIDLVRCDIRNARIGRLIDEFDLVRVIKQSFGDDMTHVDVKTLKLVVYALEMPWRIGAASAENQMTPGQNFIQFAFGFLCERRK